MPTETQRRALRRLPAVHQILERPELAPWLERLPREWITQAIADVLAMRRREILENKGDVEPDQTLVTRVEETLQRLTHPRLTPVLNATGIVLHTNLGRAVLSQAAAEAVQQ